MTAFFCILGLWYQLTNCHLLGCSHNFIGFFFYISDSIVNWSMSELTHMCKRAISLHMMSHAAQCQTEVKMEATEVSIHDLIYKVDVLKKPESHVKTLLSGK